MSRKRTRVAPAAPPSGSTGEQIVAECRARRAAGATLFARVRPFKSTWRADFYDVRGRTRLLVAVTVGPLHHVRRVLRQVMALTHLGRGAGDA